MRNKTLLHVVNVLGFILAVTLFPSAQALQIKMTVPDCPTGQTLVFDASNTALACSLGTPPVTSPTPGNCVVTVVPPSSQGAGLTAGTQVSLTASCSTGVTPITYSWNIGVLSSALTVAPGATTQYTVTPSNSAGVGATFSTTVYIGNGPPTGSVPSNCSISQSPSTSSTPVAAGTTVTLSASCASGDAVTSCAWGNGISSTACSVNITAPAATSSYSVTPSNSIGPGPTTITTVQIAGIIGPIAQNFCTGSDQTIIVNWPASGQVKPSTSGFGNQRIAFKITVPQYFSPALNITHTGFMRTAEVPGNANTFREVTVSRNACDFQSGSYMWNDIGMGDTGPSVSFSVNNPNGYQQTGSAFNINSGDTIYFNIRNSFNGSPSCGSSSCDILFDFATPNRY